MFIAESFISKYTREYNTLTELRTQQDADLMFKYIVALAEGMTKVETRIFVFSDGSILEAHTDYNGMHKLVAKQEITV